MKTTIVSLLLFLAGIASAQTAPVKVIVKNPHGKVYANDKILFVGQKKKQIFSGITNELGSFVIQLPADEIYNIKIQSIGDELEYNTLEIPPIGAGQFFEEATLFIEYLASNSFTFNALQFKTAKADLEPTSYTQLKNVVEVMKRKKDVQIQIIGHTDSDGEDQANQILSLKRAESVRNYLVSQGISSTRVRCVGMGESKPVASNQTTEGKAKNRRTEIVIL